MSSGTKVEMKEPRRPSSHVHSFGWEGNDSRGFLHVQFKNKDGHLTARGFYREKDSAGVGDVDTEGIPRGIFSAMEASDSAGSFVQGQLRNFFEWVPVTDTPPDSAKQGAASGCGCVGGSDANKGAHA